MLFYCRDCQRVVKDPKKKGTKYDYMCPICTTGNVVFGTKEAICDFFHIKEKMLERMIAEGNVKVEEKKVEKK